MEAKLQLLVEAPAAVEDALASLLSHADLAVQVCSPAPKKQQHVWHVHLAMAASTLLAFLTCPQQASHCTAKKSHEQGTKR